MAFLSYNICTYRSWRLVHLASFPTHLPVDTLDLNVVEELSPLSYNLILLLLKNKKKVECVED